MKKSKFGYLVLLSALAVILASCGKKPSSSAEVPYTRADEGTTYTEALGAYEAKLDAALQADTVDKKFVLYAQAEALLLESAVFVPTTTDGGAYTISRVAPRTVPYVQWGSDTDRFKSMVATKGSGKTSFITHAQRNQLLAAWQAAVDSGDPADYNPATMLTGWGHTLATDYKLTFSTGPVTIDIVNTSHQTDSEILVNCVDGLVEYNGLSQLKPAIAKDWVVSDGGKKYTFNLREDAYWYKSTGEVYSQVKAEDFVAGFQHMLDAKAGLEWLVEGVVKGVSEYLETDGKGDSPTFANVGYKVGANAHQLVIELERETSYFPTMLTYSCFMPICKQYFEAVGGVYGVDKYANRDTATYKFGLATDVTSNVYNGAYRLTKLTDKSEIKIEKTGTAEKPYYDEANRRMDSVTWVYDDGQTPLQTYQSVVDGTYAGTGLSKSLGTIEKAQTDGFFGTKKADGTYDITSEGSYVYISDTTSVSFFGGLNVARGTFELTNGNAKSPKDGQAKVDTAKALLNKNFRKAIAYAWDRTTWNGVTRGAELAKTNLRNMYVHPEFVRLEGEVVAAADATNKFFAHTFAAGTAYGEMVQQYLEDLGSHIQVADKEDGWYNLDVAKARMYDAMQELGTTVSYPIQLDVVYYSPSSGNTAQAQSFKQLIEGALGADKVQVNLVETATTDDFYACGYRAPDGASGNFDIFYGSGWGPDYGDPSTYLDTFRGNGEGYMTKVIGLF